MRAEPLPRKINVGIFLCKDVNEQRLKTLVENLLANARVARILIRPHPKNLWRNITARPGWRETLRSFANIDQDESAVLAETLKVIAEIRNSGKLSRHEQTFMSEVRNSRT
jgi:hypothetical protein